MNKVTKVLNNSHMIKSIQCSPICTCQNVCRTFVTREVERMSNVDVVEVENCNISEMTDPSEVGRCSQGVKVATFHQWKYNHYFMAIDESQKNMQACCTFCSPSSKPLSCARNILLCNILLFKVTCNMYVT